MGFPSDDAADVLAPTSGRRTRLANSGTNESSNGTAFKIGSYATLVIAPGSANVRVEWKATTGGANQVDSATSYLMQAGDRIDWRVTKDDCVVYIEADDGASAYEAFVWPSSHGLL